jgi:hypothetical protein
MDFWNDGEYVKGVSPAAAIIFILMQTEICEPCAFIHYSDTNIKEKTLIDALQSPLFMQYRKNQPFNENHLRPCPLLDNPPKLAQMVEASGAKSTDFISPENAQDLCAKCKGASEKWAQNADKLWEKHLIQKQQPSEITFGTQREKQLI